MLDIPPIEAIRAEQIKGRAKSFNKLINRSPKNLMLTNKEGKKMPKTIAAATLNKIKKLLYLTTFLIISLSPIPMEMLENSLSKRIQRFAERDFPESP